MGTKRKEGSHLYTSPLRLAPAPESQWLPGLLNSFTWTRHYIWTRAESFPHCCVLLSFIRCGLCRKRALSSRGRESGAREAVTGFSASSLMSIQLFNTCTRSIFPRLPLYRVLLLTPCHASHLFPGFSALVSKLLSHFIEAKPFCLSCLKNLWSFRGP